MDIFDVLREECIQVGLSDCGGKADAIRAIAHLARQCDVLTDVAEDEIAAALEERESHGSTAFGGGIALPHCRLSDVDEFVVGMICVPDGIDFDSADDEPVKLLFFIVGPESDSAFHVRLLSLISRVATAKGVLDELVAAPDAVALREAFLRHVPTELQASGAREMCLVNVFVQRDDLFTEVLQAVSSLSSSSVAVLEGANASRYLHTIPLFSAFWAGEDKSFHRVIAGVVGKKLANELVRSIDVAVGGLDKQTGVMVVVQDARFVAGSLDG